MRKLIVLLSLSIVFLKCGDKGKNFPRAGTWHAELEVMDGYQLPFNFHFSETEGEFQMIVKNAEEEVVINDIEFQNDSVLIRMPVYEGFIKAAYSETELIGHFIKESLDRVVPFHAIWTEGNTVRFQQLSSPKVDISGIWEADFSEGTEDAYKSKGIFEQNEGIVSGTFRTNKGDYRYLEGVLDGDSLKLSTFDGAHAFLFLAKVTDTTMNGIFYSGNHFKEPFVAISNREFELDNADELTYLKEGYDRIEFSFPNSSGENISLSDADYEDKVVIVQIMGTWCPNCMDETKFLVEYLRENEHPNLQIIALAFEYARSEQDAFAGINRLKERIGVTYPVLLAQYGSSNKVKANEKLPMLNHVLSYPTTIFIDKKGGVRRIHTGFNGPATGDKYLAFKEDFAEEVSGLLSE